MNSARLPDGSTESYLFTADDAGSFIEEGDPLVKIYGTSMVSPAAGVGQDMIDSINKHHAIYYRSTLTDAITYPFTTLALKWKPDVTVNGTTTETSYNLSSYSGLCVTYKSERAVPMKLKPANYSGDWNLYQVILPASTSITSKYFPFSEFAQEPWGVKVANNLTKQNMLMIQHQNAAGTSNILKIYQIGLGNACNGNDNYYMPDAFEPANDAKVTAPTLATTGPSNAVADLTLPSAADVDYFQFTLDHMSRTKISLPMFIGTDITMQVLDLAGNEVASTTTTTGTYLMQNLEAGTYFVKLSTAGSVETYSLAVTETPEATPEMLYRNGNEKIASALLALNASFYSYQDKAGYSKWYTSAPSTSKTVDVLQKAGEYAGIGADWGIATDFSAWSGLCVTYKADQNVRVAIFAKNDDNTGYNHYEKALNATSDQFVSIHIPWNDFAQGDPNGTLVSKAWALENAMGIRFLTSQTAVAQRLQVAQIGLGNTCDNTNNPAGFAADGSEPNNSLATATTFDVQNSPTNLNLHQPSDVDYYKLVLPKAAMLTIDIFNIVGYGASLKLLDQAGSTIRATTTLTSSAQTKKLLSAGTYYIQVSGSYEVKSYKLAATLGEAPADQIVWSKTKNSGTQILYNGATGGYWYSFTDGKFGSVSGSPFTISNSNLKKWNSVLTGARLGSSATALGLGAIGFDWTANKTPSDLSAHNGVCVTYRSAKSIRMQMNQKDAGTYDQYSYSLPAATKWTKTYIPFTSLAQVGWDNHPFLFDPSNQESVQFIFENQPVNSSTVIEIAQVGLGDVCEEQTVPSGLTVANTLLWDAQTPDTTPDQLDIGGGIAGGYWFDYSDASSGGTSVVSRINDSYGVATASLNLGSRFGKENQAPFAAMGANFTDPEQAVNLSKETGVCVTYRATRPVLATLQQNNQASYDDFVAEIPAQTQFNARLIPFSSFHQRGFGFAQPLDPSVLTQIHFRDTTSGNNMIEIAQIGRGSTCTNVRFAPKALITPAPLDLNEDFSEQRIDLSAWFEDRDGSFNLSVVEAVDGILDARIEGKNLVLTSIQDQKGIVQLTITATDADGQKTSIKQIVNIANVVDLPVAIADKYATDEDTSLIVSVKIGLLANDKLGDESSLAITDYDQPAHGTLTLSPGGNFSYTPEANYNGTDTFSYTINGKASGTVTIEVKPVNDLPKQVGTLSPPPDPTEDFGSFTINLSGLFTDIENDPLLLSAQVTTGKVTVSIDQKTHIATIRSVLDYCGPVSISFTASDMEGTSNAATTSFNVIAAIDIPVAQNIAVSINEDAILAFDVASGVMNPDKQPYTVEVKPGSNYTVESVSATEYNIKPAQDYNGKLTVHFVVTADNGNKVTEADVSITVNPMNDNPTAIGEILQQPVEEDFAPFTILTSSLFRDVDGDALSFFVSASNDLVKATINASTGVLTLASNPNKNGTVTITVSANDKVTGSTPATIQFDLKINAVDDAPVAFDALYKVVEDSRLSVTVFKNGILSNATDIEGNSLSALLVTAPAHGKLTLNADGTFEYAPDANWFGNDFFTFQANDGELSSAVKTVTLEVRSLNDLPVAVADVYEATEDTKLIIDAEHGILTNDSDLESTTLIATLVTAPTHGKVVIQSDGSFEYTPNANFYGTDVFYYKIQDTDLDFSNAVSVTINVNAVNDAPVAVARSYKVNEDATLIATPIEGVLNGATDPEGNKITALVGTQPSHGNLTLASDGSFEYKPNANFNGKDSFTIIPTDGDKQGLPVTITITVDALNDKPIKVAQLEDQTLEEDFATKTISLSETFSDVDGDGLRYTVSTSNKKLSASISSTTLTLQSVKDSNGVSTIKIYVFDIGSTPADSMFFNVEITSVSDVPTTVADAYTVKEDETLTVSSVNSVLKNDFDGDGDPITAILGDKPSHGTLTLAADGSFTYKPEANFYGTDQFTYKAKDATEAGNLVTVTITVENVNDKPEIIAEPEDIELKVNFAAFTVNLDEFFSDKDGDKLTYSLSSTNLIKTSIDGSELVVESLKDKMGKQTITITAKDPSGTRSMVLLNVTVSNTTSVHPGELVSKDWHHAVLNGRGCAELTRLDGSRIAIISLPASPEQVFQAMGAESGITVLKIQGRTWNFRN